jgi:hypothetical protein
MRRLSGASSSEMNCDVELMSKTIPPRITAIDLDDEPRDRVEQHVRAQNVRPGS